MRKLVASIVLVAFCSCSKHHSEVGQYVYVNCFHTIHIDRECASQLSENPKTKEERMANMHGITFVDTCNLTITNGTWSYKFCPKCVDDDAYELLLRISEQNQQIAPVEIDLQD